MTTVETIPTGSGRRDVRVRPAVRRTEDRRGPVLVGLRAVLDVVDDPASLGRVLLLAAGTIVVLTTPLLGPTRTTWTAVAVISAVMLVAAFLSARVDWTRHRAELALVHPALVAAGLVVLGLSTPEAFGPLVGVLVLCFAFIGLTQAPGTSLYALPFAGGTQLVMLGQVSAPVLVRLAIAMLISLLLGELLSRMTQRQRVLTEALQVAAHSDALTGVANRRDWDRRLRLATPGTVVVVCDLDHFKALNDTQGHRSGDHVLADFGGLLLEFLRGDDYCARVGGEEFALLLPNTATEDAVGVLARLHEQWGRLRPDVTFSAGLATCTVGRPNEATLDAADAALYEAKRGGRDTDRVEAAPLTVG